METHTRKRNHFVDRRLHGDEGTAMIELALVMPFLFAITMGIMEAGFMVKNSLTLTTALRLSARSEAQSLGFSARRWAEYDALDMFRSLQLELKNATMNRLVVYKPTNTAGAAPTNCLSTTPVYPNGTGFAGCNIYGTQQLADFATASTKTSRFGSSASTTTCDANDWDRFWCTPTRGNSLVTGLDTVCIYAEFTYTYFTRIIPGGSRTLSDRACAQIEPSS